MLLLVHNKRLREKVKEMFLVEKLALIDHDSEYGFHEDDQYFCESVPQRYEHTSDTFLKLC
ncbi:hypothetical protein DsansV1_C04g0046201 [Dioscorea sansibarensis]